MTNRKKLIDVTASLGPVSRKSRELFGPEKPFVKLRPAYSVKLVFSYVVKGIKAKITAKFRASRRLRFEDTKRIMSPEIRPKSFGFFEKPAPGLKLPFFHTRKGILKIDQSVKMPWHKLSMGVACSYLSTPASEELENLSEDESSEPSFQSLPCSLEEELHSPAII